MKYFFLAVIFMSFEILFSQAVSGNVYDQNTGQPIEMAAVYIDGSSIGTITDEQGYFSIDPKFNSNAKLVVSYIGFKTVHISHENLGQNLIINLQEDVFEVPEVVLVSDPFSRRQKLEVFKEEFLGDTKGGENSLILNEEVIELHFNSSTNTLSAYAKEPIAVQNEYLGYLLKFDLQNFEIRFKSKSLERIDNVDSTILYGSTFFEDVAEDEQKYLVRRKNAYTGSIQHFLRTLWNQNWFEESFEIRKGYKKIKVSDAFSVSSGSNMYSKKVSLKIRDFKIKYREGIFNYWSSLKLLSGNTINIDQYGSYTPYLQLKFGGHMASLRIGDLLPLDYEDNLLID